MTEVPKINIVEVAPIRMKYCVIGLPDVGLVGSIAAGYVISSLKMDEVGYFESDLFPPITVIHRGDPKAPFRLYGKGDLGVVISEVPVPVLAVPALARDLVDWLKSKGVQLLVSATGVAVQNRLEIDTPEVYGVGASPSDKELLNKAEIKLLEEGFMVGPYALILRECTKQEVPNIVLLAQSHYQYPDPGAAASVLTSLNKLLGLSLDIEKLLKQTEQIRLRTRELMQRTRRSMISMQKAQEQEIPSMYV
ncbi:MAG: proteasome assembly chaperone family protein [Candidatus Bathyarchaeia archaeon]